MKTSLNRFLLLALSAWVFASCGGRVIPRDKMAHIYADMFLAEQWIADNPASRRVADTTFVYAQIFEKYGYDADDYRASVEHYLDDPERFSKILRKSASILEAHAEELKTEKKEIQAQKPKVELTFDFDRVMVQTDSGLLRMADRDSIEYFRDSAGFMVFDPFYMDVFEKSRVKDSPIMDKSADDEEN